MNPLAARFITIVAFTVIGLQTACSNFRAADSPDIIYDSSAGQARALQIPPDLTDVSNSEQFVLPGTRGGAVTRNTLLPQFDSVRFVREGDQSWLMFDQAPENIWPQLLAFARQQKYRIEQTEPVAGVIVTQWRPASAVAKGNLLTNLIGGNEEYSRIAFRLERAGTGARLFARSQAASEAIALANTDMDWPASSHDPEVTAALLSRLLVFLGIEEQKSRGIIDSAQAQAVLQDAIIQTSASGSQLLVNRGFQSSFNAIVSALQALEYPISSRDDGVGRIEFSDAGAALVLELLPVHVSAVRVELTDDSGGRLSSEQERQLLNALLGRLA